MDDQLRRHAEQHLADQYPHLRVAVGGARWIEGQGIALYDLEFVDASLAPAYAKLLQIDEMLLQCDASLASFVAGMPAVQRVVVKHPHLWARRQNDGSWNVAGLFPTDRSTDQQPVVLIEGGAASISDGRMPTLPPLVVRDIQFLWRPGESRDHSTAEMLPRGKFAGTFSGPRLREATVRGTIGADLVQATLKLDELRVGGELWQWCAANAPVRLGGGEVSGQVEGAISVSWRPALPDRPTIEASLTLDDGQINHPRLPRPISALAGRFSVAGEALRVEQLRGVWGNARFALAVRREGWDQKAPVAVAGQIANLPLDKQLYDVLPAELQEQWNKYVPAGVVDVDAFEVAYDGKTWRAPTATLSGRSLSFESDKFRYRLARGAGTIRVGPAAEPERTQVDVALTGYSGEQPVQIVGQIIDPQPEARGWIEISGKSLEVEKAMIAALPAKPRQVITELHPRGKFDVFWRLERHTPGGAPETQLQLELVDVSINYDRFAYPLRGVRGTVRAHNQHWTFHQLQSGGRRNVQCQGHLEPSPAGPRLELTFTGQRLPLDDDLFEAVDEKVQRAWSELRPKGHVDFTARVTHLAGQPRPQIWASIHPLPETASIQPKFFDYRMDRLAGEVTYQDGRIELLHVEAHHGDTTITTGGSGQFEPSGAWHVQLAGLTVDRLKAARDLLAALPPKMAIMIDTLEPRGNFSLSSGILTFQKPASPTAPVESQWDVLLDCHQADLQCGIELTDLHGSVRLLGAVDGQRSYSRGELHLESAVFEDMQFTNVRGPFWVDETQFRLGRWASQPQGTPPRRLTAELLGGAVAADAGVNLAALPVYRVELAIEDMDLTRLIAERFGDSSDVAGKVDGQVTFEGEGRLIDGLEGEGDIHVHDANIYESPILLRLLKTLRYGKRDATAFNEVNAKFRLVGQHVYLSKLDFLGDVVNLYGEGYTNFDHDLKLRFHGQVGRNKYLLPAVQNVVGEVNRQIMEVYVDGTLGNPQVHTQALPGFSQLLGGWQGGTAGPLEGQRQALFPVSSSRPGAR